METNRNILAAAREQLARLLPTRRPQLPSDPAVGPATSSGSVSTEHQQTPQRTPILQFTRSDDPRANLPPATNRASDRVDRGTGRRTADG